MHKNMWCDTTIFCPECHANLKVYAAPSFVQKCENCDVVKKRFKCFRENCKFQYCLCLSCDLKESQSRPSKQKKPESTNSTGTVNLHFIAAACFCILVALFLYSRNNSSQTLENVNLLEKLRKDFPSQRKETWHHFLSVLEKEKPTVKSIIFLHDGDKRTPDCLAHMLVSLYSGNKSIQSEDVTFSAAGYEGRDYGFALEHYHSVVKKFRVFVTDLTKVSGNIARIFHSLCDEFSSDIKPSLFIFFLKYDEQTEMLKPMKRAESILKEAWSDLPDNEIYPLISRVVKNVVDVVPEKAANC